RPREHGGGAARAEAADGGDEARAAAGPPGRLRRAAARGVAAQEAARRRHLHAAGGKDVRGGAPRGGPGRQDDRRARRALRTGPHGVGPGPSRGRGAGEAGRAGGAVPVRGPRRPVLAGGERALSEPPVSRPHASSDRSRRIGLVGPVHPWRGGLAQYLQMLGEALQSHAELSAVTFKRQYPGILFPGTTQFDLDAPRPGFLTVPLLDSIDPFSWRRSAAHLERFAPGAVILKWWMPFFGPAFASTVGPLRRRGTRVVLVCDNLVGHEPRVFDRAFSDWMLRNSDGYLVMSDAVERDLDRLKPGAPRRRVPHPFYAQFDRQRWTRETARASLNLSGDVALFFGYVRHYKGLDTLLAAWKRVRAV